MSQTDKIICKPTSWFLLRAGMIFTMFSVFSVLFYIDGTTGYRKKNYEYYVNATFKEATAAFSRMDAQTPLTERAWREFASKQTINFPENPEVIPADLKLPMPWPDILTDFQRVKSLQNNQLWREYSAEEHLSEKPAEEPFAAGKIKEQIHVFYICASLSVVTLFFLIRTSRRRLIADTEALISAEGKSISYQSMRVLDLRKWEGKGIAFIEYESASGAKRARIDGLTYGGFSQDKNQPAEALMRQIRSNFTGDIIDYAVEEEKKTQDTREDI